MLDDILSFTKTTKMWVAGAIAAVGQFINLVQAATADESISFDEAKGLWMALVALLSTLATMAGVYWSKNKE